MGKPRLLVLASTYPARPDDGTPSFVRDLALGMTEAFDVEVLVPAVRGGAPREQTGALGVTRFRYFPRRWENLADGAILENIRARRARVLQVPFFIAAEYLAVRRAIRRHHPDVIHAHWIIPQGLVARIATRTIPTVVTTLGGDLYALRSGFARRLKSKVVRSAVAVTVMNEEMGEAVISLGAARSAVSVMPMGFDLAAFSAPSQRTPSDVLRLLFVGRLVEKKGLGVLLDALRESPPAVPWRLTVIGDGPLRASLEREAEGLPVAFAGQRGREGLVEAYSHADVVIFPSVRSATGDQDGLPVALLEAMGSGCAVVASDLPGLNLAVVDGHSGLLVPSGDPGPLARAIDRLARDPAERQRLARGATSRAERFNVATVAADYRELLLRVAKGPADRG